MRMKPPMSRLSRRDRRRSGGRASRLQTPISLSSSVRGRQVLERVDVDLVLGRRRSWPSTVRAPIFMQVAAAAAASASSSIQTMVASNWSATSAGSSAATITSPRLMSISSASVERDRLAGDGLVEVAVERDDARDGARPARRQDAHARRPAGRAPPTMVPEKPRKSRFGPVDPLHRHAERLARAGALVDLDGLEVPDQRRARRTRACCALGLDDVVAAQRRHRDAGDVGRGRAARRTSR